MVTFGEFRTALRFALAGAAPSGVQDDFLKRVYIDQGRIVGSNGNVLHMAPLDVDASRLSIDYDVARIIDKWGWTTSDEMPVNFKSTHIECYPWHVALRTYTTEYPPFLDVLPRHETRDFSVDKCQTREDLRECKPSDIVALRDLIVGDFPDGGPHLMVKLVKHVLATIPGDRVVFEIGTKNQPVVIRGGNEFTAVVMPVRV